MWTRAESTGLSCQGHSMMSLLSSWSRIQSMCCRRASLWTTAKSSSEWSLFAAWGLWRCKYLRRCQSQQPSTVRRGPMAISPDWESIFSLAPCTRTKHWVSPYWGWGCEYNWCLATDCSCYENVRGDVLVRASKNDSCRRGVSQAACKGWVVGARCQNLKWYYWQRAGKHPQVATPHWSERSTVI